MNNNINNHIIPTPNTDSQIMLDNLKSLMIITAIMRGSTQTNPHNTLINVIITIFLVSFIDSIVLQIKTIFNFLLSSCKSYITNKHNTIDIPILYKIKSIHLKNKKVSIIIKLETDTQN